MFRFFFLPIIKRKKKAYIIHKHLSYMFYHLEKKRSLCFKFNLLIMKIIYLVNDETKLNQCLKTM